MEQSEETKTVHIPHDKGYKGDLSHPREFIHFLKKYVKAEWTKELTESQLTLCDKEFLDKDYEGREADLIYRVRKINGQEIYIFILQELQSTVDYTMIFRITMYVVNTLLRYFLNTEKSVREQKNFRLPAMIPIVFYNGEENWTAVTNFRDYQTDGRLFGNHVLNLEYYLVNLSAIEEDELLSTNTVLDNIMYCDKFRKKQELVSALRTAHERVQVLGEQEKEEFHCWVKSILLSVCKNKESVIDELLRWTGNGEENMAFKYNIVKMFEDERAEGKAEGRAAAILELLEDLEPISDNMKNAILTQTDLEVCKRWLKCAAKATSLDDWKQLVEWKE